MKFRELPSGKPQKQAIAIAMNVAGKSNKKKGKLTKMKYGKGED